MIVNVRSMIFGPAATGAAVTAAPVVPGETALAGLRVAVGLAMAFSHGLGKVPPSENFVAGVAALGFPAPGLFAWAAGGAELAGGLCLALGLATRPAAFFIAFTMCVAFFGRHANDEFRVKELAFIYLVLAVAFLVRGGGRYAVDRKLLP